MATVIAPNGSAYIELSAGQAVAIATRGQAGYSSRAGGSGLVLDSINPVVSPAIVDSEVVTSAFASGGKVLVQNMGPFLCYVEKGLAPLSKDYRRESGKLGSAIALNATGTITTAMVLSGAVSSTSAAGVTATLETGAVMDAATEWDIGEGYNWGVINTGPSLFTVTAAATGHTLTGLGTVATTTAAQFRTVKTAAETFVTTRVG